MTLQPGQTIGRYQIIEPLGVGGMATVYKAFQPSLEREVALKVLRPGFAEDPEFFQRFQREARSIARLRHPNIVQVFDFEPLDGRYVLAMEFLEGGTLKERVASLAARGERLPHGEVARIVGEVAAALTYGHELGIIHRDVKPANVMLSHRDRAVVTDFGIAKIIGGEGQTQTGVGIGTPEYMAPEQGTGTKVDHRADIYSLGVMAYEMLTGRVPFTADTPIAIVLAHMRDPLPLPSTIDPSIPPAAEHVLMKTLAKEPNDRYPSATDFADALRTALVPPPATAATVHPIPAPQAAVTTTVTASAPAAAPLAGVPRTVLIGAALLVVLVLAAAAFALTRGTSPAAAAVLFELDPARAQQQLQPRGPAQLRPVPNAVEIVVEPARFVKLEPAPAVYTSDFDATMRVRLVSGTGRIGLYFHGASDGDVQLTVNTQGEIVLERADPRAPQPTSLARYSVGSAAGRDFELRVVATGTAITTYADGKEVGRATAPQRTGAIGILVGSYESAFTAHVQKLRISGTAVAAPVGGPGPGGPAPGAPGAPGPGQAGPGPSVVLPSKGALIAQADLKTTAAVFGASGQNQARVVSEGLTLETREQPGIGLHAPAAPPPGTYGDLITEVRAMPAGSTTAQYRLQFGVGAGQGGTFVQVRLNPGGRVLVEIARDDPAAGGHRQLAASPEIVSAAPAHTLLVLRQGAQLAAFINGQFAASATDPQPQRGGIDLAVPPLFGPGSQQPVGTNSVRIEAWAIYERATTP